MYKKITTIEEHSDVPFSQGNGIVAKYTPHIKVDIPLMIRLLEYAREDAKSDVDLHTIVSEMVELSGGSEILTMEDYEDIMEDVPVGPPSPEAPPVTA